MINSFEDINPLVSVIIPTFNRGSILGLTLESIVRQTFQNWECIIIDDGSEDQTYKTIFPYLADSRMKYYKRPSIRLRGANSCRNYGFEKSKGEFIIWFDSDDLMTIDHIEEKVKAIKKTNNDFVVSQTANFTNEEVLAPYVYEKKDYGITASDFILLKIHWYTYDVLLTRGIAEKISWNEQMNSWQDYNYFCKMLLVTVNGKYIDKVLTHRRLHEQSIQSNLTRNRLTFQEQLLKNHYLNYLDIHSIIDLKTKNELIYGMMNLSFSLAKNGVTLSLKPQLELIIRRDLSLLSVALFKLSLLSVKLTGKGNVILELAKRKNSSTS